MVRVISQETYDEMVKENIEDLEMSPEEAITEAIEQLEAQNVDLSNIIKDLAITTQKVHLVTEAIIKIKELWNTQNKETIDIITQLNVLKAECDKDLGRKLKASKDGAYSLLLEILDHSLKENLDKLSVAVLQTLHSLMDQNPDLLEQKGVQIIKRILDGNTNEDVMIAILKWASVCCVKHEKNRQSIFATDIVSTLKILLKEKNNSKFVPEMLQLVRRLCLDDDIRVEFGKAHEHAREIAIYTLDSLVFILKENRAPPLVSDIMLTIAGVLVRHEFCARAADAGIGDVITSVITDNYTNNIVVQQAFKLVTALAGHDDVKRSLIKSGIAPLIILVINHNMSQQTTVSLGLKCVSALCLREPTHALEFIQNGAPEMVCDAMNRYPDNANLQKNACWSIRNMVSRCQDQNTKFLELGAEKLLNLAFEKYKEQFGFDAQSALRDLQCEVNLKEQWTGKGIQMAND